MLQFWAEDLFVLTYVDVALPFDSKCMFIESQAFNGFLIGNIQYLVTWPTLTNQSILYVEISCHNRDHLRIEVLKVQ